MTLSPEQSSRRESVLGAGAGARSACARRGEVELVSLRKIAYLTPLYFDETSCLGGGERFPLNLAIGVVHASGGTCEVELVSYGERSFGRPLRPGVSLRVLRADNRPARRTDVVSWELPEAIADADLVHIHSVYSRSGEIGLLLAKQQQKPLCVTDHGGPLEHHRPEPGDPRAGRSDHRLLRLRCLAVFDPNADRGDPRGCRRRPVHPGPAASRPATATRSVLFVGRLLPHKGIDHLIAALPPELPLTVCGRPYHEPFHRRLLEAWPRGSGSTFVTDADDAPILDLYRRPGSRSSPRSTATATASPTWRPS